MNKNNLGLVLATATLIFGGCKNANNVDIVEVDSSEVTQNLMVDSEEIKELVDSDDNEEMDEVENELIDMELLVSTGSSSGSSSNNKPSTSIGSSSGSSSNNKPSTSTGSSSGSSLSNKPSTSTGSSSGSSSNSGTSSNNGSSSNSGTSSNNGSSSNSGTTTPSNPTPPVAEQPKPQQPVDILDWNYIKSTLIAKGNSLGMILDTSLTRDNQGYESPWQSSYMPVTNEDVIGYIGSQMESVAKWGWEYFNLDMVVQADGNVLIYLIR